MNKTLPLPLDVRLMNMTTALLVAVLVWLSVAAGVWWLIRHPMFAIESITVQGEVGHNNAVTLRANVMPKLSGNFFTLDLAQARDAFEDVPWVRTAVVQRDFPNRLRTILQEHHPVALWGEEDANTMVNEQGQVFEANVEDADVEQLPRMKGPVGLSADVMRMYRYLQPLFQALDMDIEQMELTPRGSWRVLLQGGAQIELGRGTEAEIGLTVQRFLRTLSQVTSRYGRTPTALLAADLRHKDGYALRLRGVSTVDVDSKKKP
ncbi:cell division protein FtsQ [Limnohabitans sp. T6-5]|uniref:cell division protein FtsQ/DivIB n=1 Tax=Limnohabitans sp. T6-5 TaxID=1100724 RepID=UPI000D3B771B|nr:cell division protein FtsQ/DivIB [Limnohabitans sp. T6-5]PUE11588.1 cell division protein FtsQ [Limnohabitans sp. T6-5]